MEAPISGISVATWNLSGDDDGEPFIMSFAADVSFQVEGDFGGSVVIEGSNYKNSPVWRTLSDPQGNALSFTFGKIEQLLETVYQLRPRATGITGVTVKLFMRQSS
jgi:hypothetical protein